MQPIPFPAGTEPYPYQLAGAQFVIDRGSGIIADDPGLGKTAQALLVYNSLPGCPRVLVVCPASLKQNWANEAKTWMCPPGSVRIAEGDYWPTADLVIARGFQKPAVQGHQKLDLFLL